MLLLAVGLGIVSFLIFVILLVVLLLTGKKAGSAVIGLGVSIVLLLGGGLLFTISENGTLPKANQKKPANVPTNSTATDTQRIDTTPTQKTDNDKNDAAAAPAETEPTSTPNEDGIYRIGDTWTVDGQWSVTVTGVTETSDRNQYSEKNPEAVYILDFTYTNLGYEEKYSDGVFISLGGLGTIVDSKGIMAYDYPGDVDKHPVETPVGATCNAQSCIGVDNKGDFKIVYSTYDGNSERQTATFEINVD